MKNDKEVRRYMQERSKGLSQQRAAARTGMSERTARKYEQARQLPSQLKRPHDWTTRSNPFEEDWAWVVSELEPKHLCLGSKVSFVLSLLSFQGAFR